MPCAQRLQRVGKNGLGTNSEQSQTVHGQLRATALAGPVFASEAILGSVMSVGSGWWVAAGRSCAMRSSWKVGEDSSGLFE